MVTAHAAVLDRLGINLAMVAPMWLETPAPSPSPIDVHVAVSMPPIKVPPDTTLDNYTHALANWTEALAIFTLVLALVGGIALWLQRREIRATEEQLRLTRDEFQRAQKNARPELIGSASFPASRQSSTKVVVEQIHGTEPAYDVRVLVRWQHDGVQRTAVARCGTLAPAHSKFEETLRAANEQAWPGKEPPKELTGDNYWLGLTWKRTDGEVIKIGEMVERGEHIPSRVNPPGFASSPTSET